MSVLAEIPVEDVLPGQRIQLSQRDGPRLVLQVLEYDTLGMEEVDCFVFLVEADGAGRSWENRSGMKGVPSFHRRDRVALRPFRRGELVHVERLHLVGAAA